MPNVLHRRFVPNPAQNRPSHIMIEKKNKCQQFHTGTRLSRPYLLISYTGIISLLVLREDRPHFCVINTELHLKKKSPRICSQTDTHTGRCLLNTAVKFSFRWQTKKDTNSNMYQKNPSYCFRSQSNFERNLWIALKRILLTVRLQLNPN